MQLTRLAITRHLATIAIFVALAVAGISAYVALPINEFPQVNIPVVTVTTTYAGANPQAIETQITRPIEDAVASLNNVDTTTSTSAEGFSAVTITFTDQADSKQISTDVERQVNTIVATLPSGADRPIVQKIDLSQIPVMELAVVDDNQAPEALYSIAHDQVLPSLEQIGGVSQVALIGGRQEEVHVAVDPTRLAAYGVSLSQVQTALAAANSQLPGGSVSQGPRQYDLQVNGLYANPLDLGNVVVTSSTSQSGSTLPQQVRVRDVATVSVGASEQTQVTRVNGHQAIRMSIGQANGSNLTDVTDAVYRLLPQLRAQLPSSSQLVVVQDSSPFVRSSLTGIEEELVTAVILTSVVLLAFLHNPRAAIIVLFSIPTTLLTTFISMRLMGFSLNFLSTLGLTLTIGILVDDSIVVLENILRHLERGEPPQAAALMGRAEIGLAALAITLVDVVVFAPTGLVSGQIGAFFREFGFTIAAATLMSLGVSFTLTPMLAARLLRPEHMGTSATGNWLSRFGHRWDRGFNALEKRYERLLGWSLRHRLVTLGVAASTVALGVALLATGKVSTEFIPNADSGYFSISTEAPPGTSLAAHDVAMQQIEQTVIAMPEVQSVTASIGVSASGLLGSGSTGQARFGSVTVQLVPLSSGRRSVDAIVADARNQLADVPGVSIKVSSSGGGGGGSSQPVAVNLQGPDLATLNDLATQLGNSFAATPGLVNVTNSAPVGQPQILVNVDQARAADVGVSAASLGTAVRTAFAGVVATKYQKQDATLEDVRLELTSTARTDINQVGDLPIQTASGQTVPLRAVADISQTQGPTQINRKDRQRVVTVSADLDTGYTLGQVNPGVQRAMRDLQVPVGYTAGLGASSQSQAQAFGQLATALGASILLAYLLMSILYNSLIHPLVILFALPAAVGGAIVGLLIFGYSFSVFAMIGMILLVGLAIKNGILLVDRTNHNRARGMDRLAALQEAGPARLRPILMTSTTIAIALFPTALRFGEGAELRAPLAAAVLGGVISSTLLTLVLVPVMYTLLDGLPTRVGGRVVSLFRHGPRSLPIPLPVRAEIGRRLHLPTGTEGSD
ncbi:MAG: efflux RND transporter permease subunit [Chloroflexi bacterium]|nr:efflux RND transporter permease subunit [Chloroflexota bacterium]